MTGYAGVVPLTRLGRAGTAYTYAIPDCLNDVRAGTLVAIPFINRRITGIVLDVSEHADRDNLKHIIEIVDPEPSLVAYQLELARWISSEYAAPLGATISAMVPPGYAAKGAVEPTRRRPVRTVRLLPLGLAVLEDPSLLKRAPKQRLLLEALRDRGGDMLESDLVRSVSGAASVEAKIAARGWIRLEVSTMSSVPPAAKAPHPNLSPAQAESVAAITAALDRECPESPAPVFLLHGVTGSGKTEVYMNVIAEVLRRGRQAIVMVPEISLTPQAISRFETRFPGRIAALHSALSSGDRRAEWNRVRRGEAAICIGARSALFAPMPRLGIVVVDEEHDGSYKQAETPRYHARDVAVHLGAMLRIPVVLGSATPDVSSYFAARKGRYRLLTLPDRPVWDHAEGGRLGSTPPARRMPGVEIVDLRQELKAGHRGIFSRSLIGALTATFAARQQALLFLNRRGSATAVVCRHCGHVAQCPRCEIPLTYHGHQSLLICHRCDRRTSSPRYCPVCHGSQIRFLGVGTERVVEEAQRLLPEARIIRWDRDVTAKKNAHENIAAMFGRHEADVLVGTQMIAKGLDFPLVTLVGVILADVGLHVPDFRASERAFQLMTQVAGRAGRADLPSRVVVQTYSPDHYALHAARDHDYWQFYRQEMMFRLRSRYPPFSRLARFLIRDRSSVKAANRARSLTSLLQERIGETGSDVELIGPAPAFVARVNDVHQWHLIAKGSELRPILEVVPDEIVVDVDPIDLL